MNIFGIGRASKSGQEKKIAELEKSLGKLESEYAENHSEYATLEAVLGTFRNRYYLLVGSLFVRLDVLRAELKAILAENNPEDFQAKEEAEQAREQAQETEEEVSGTEEDAPTQFKPTASLKTLFRKAAKMIHPDRAKNDLDRKFRDKLMAEINSAYRNQNSEAIEEVIKRYQEKLDLPEFDELDMRIAHLQVLIENTKSQIEQIKKNYANLMTSHWYKLHNEVHEGEKSGRDVLQELENKLYAEILEEQEKIQQLLKEKDRKKSKAKTTNVSGSTKAKATDKKKSRVSNTSFYENHLIHTTSRGENVRSKSELVIANTLHSMGIDYRYEYPIEGSDKSPGVRRPDFTFFKPKGLPILWEHLGMLDNSEYATKWQAKLAWYKANKFKVGVNLFITSDNKDEGLDSQEIRVVALKIQKLISK